MSHLCVALSFIRVKALLWYRIFIVLSIFNLSGSHAQFHRFECTISAVLMHSLGGICITNKNDAWCSKSPCLCHKFSPHCGLMRLREAFTATRFNLLVFVGVNTDVLNVVCVIYPFQAFPYVCILCRLSCLLPQKEAKKCWLRHFFASFIYLVFLVGCNKTDSE